MQKISDKDEVSELLAIIEMKEQTDEILSKNPLIQDLKETIQICLNTLSGTPSPGEGKKFTQLKLIWKILSEY